MTERVDITPREFTADMPLAQELQRLVLSTQQTLDLIPVVSLRWLRGVVATGTAGTVMPPISWGTAPNVPTVATGPSAPPDVAFVVRARESRNPSQDVGNVRSRLNFDFRSGSDGVHNVILYEPEGLTADTAYDLVVLFVGGVP